MPLPAFKKSSGWTISKIYIFKLFPVRYSIGKLYLHNWFSFYEPLDFWSTVKFCKQENFLNCLQLACDQSLYSNILLTSSFQLPLTSQLPLSSQLIIRFYGFFFCVSILFLCHLLMGSHFIHSEYSLVIILLIINAIVIKIDNNCGGVFHPLSCSPWFERFEYWNRFLSMIHEIWILE